MRRVSWTLFLTWSIEMSALFRASRKACSPPAWEYWDCRALSSSSAGTAVLAAAAAARRSLRSASEVAALLDDGLQLSGVDGLELVGPGAQVVPDGLDDLGGRDVEALGLDEDGRLVGAKGGDDRGQVLGQGVGRRALLEA